MSQRGLSTKARFGLLFAGALLVLIAVQKGTDRATSFTLCSASMTQVEGKPRLNVTTSAGAYYVTDPDVIEELAGEDGSKPKIGEKFGGKFDGLGEYRLEDAEPPETTVGIAPC